MSISQNIFLLIKLPRYFFKKHFMNLQDRRYYIHLYLSAYMLYFYAK